jgi:hypothetical protein
MRLNTTRPDPKTAIKSATFQHAAVKRVIDEDTGERVGWMRPAYGEIEWSSFHLQGFAKTEAEALKAIEAAVIEHRGFEADANAYADEVMALPKPAREARLRRDRALTNVETERQRNVIRPDDLEMAEARLLIAEAELADAMAAVQRRAA